MPGTSRPRFSCAAAVAALDAPARDRATERLRALGDGMWRVYSRSLRDDSRLAYLHASEQIDAPPEEVMADMAFVQWLSEATDYQAICEATLPLIAARAKSVHKLRDWAAVWRITREYGPELLKYHLVHQMGGVPNLRASPRDGARGDQGMGGGGMAV
jgi:hypothetical protein